MSQLVLPTSRRKDTQSRAEKPRHAAAKAHTVTRYRLRLIKEDEEPVAEPEVLARPAEIAEGLGGCRAGGELSCLRGRLLSALARKFGHVFVRAPVGDLGRSAFLLYGRACRIGAKSYVSVFMLAST